MGFESLDFLPSFFVKYALAPAANRDWNNLIDIWTELEHVSKVLLNDPVNLGVRKLSMYVRDDWQVVNHIAHG